MPNTNSAKKAHRGSIKKRAHNQFWKVRVKNAVKSLKSTIGSKIVDSKVINDQLKVLQKAVDKASKEKAIHKNKANRLKSNYAHKIFELVTKNTKKNK